jgi:cellulose synthase/poly-beta-1,6-N-acetylglucosamine synthase-like glycosyltransferase
VCARNEERVVMMPVKSALAARYPGGFLDVIVLADNCTDATVATARAAGATVWEKTTPSAGKGDVLAWGIARVRATSSYDAVAVFDADNMMSETWFDRVNDALLGGETVVTGRRQASNARANVIAGWYAVYWSIMNELSNRVRTNLSLSGKLTGTGFAFLLSALPPEGWKTRTLVEDVEFSVQHNLRGHRVAYLPDALYSDEQPVTVRGMWRQLRRWATGGWQVVFLYSLPWLVALARRPSCRLFDCFFAIVTGISVAFIQLFNAGAFVVKLAEGAGLAAALPFFAGIFLFVCAMGWIMGVGAVLLSPRMAAPSWRAVATFPVFSLILSAGVLYTLVFPTRTWKPIVHKGDGAA